MGALTATREVRVTVGASPPAPVPAMIALPGSTPSAAVAASATVTLLPHGATFTEPVRVTVPIVRAGLPDDVRTALDMAITAAAQRSATTTMLEDVGGLAGRLVVLRLDDDTDTTWEPVATGVEVTADGRLSFTTDRFSHYAVSVMGGGWPCRACNDDDNGRFARCVIFHGPVGCAVGRICEGTLRAPARGVSVEVRQNICACGIGTARVDGVTARLANSPVCSMNGTCSVQPGQGRQTTCTCNAGASGARCETGSMTGTHLSCADLGTTIHAALSCPMWSAAGFETDCAPIVRAQGSACHARWMAFARCVGRDVRGNFGCESRPMDQWMSRSGATVIDNPTCGTELTALMGCM